MLKKIVVLFSIILISLGMAACGTDNEVAEEAGNAQEPVIVATDYSEAAHWMALPTAPTKEVDVFYLYPTAWHKIDQNDPNICDIDNPLMLEGAKVVLTRQASAFETTGNIYAPYYRQADSTHLSTLSVPDQDKFIQGVPLTDCLAAFDYYIKHYNNGRPFILASHSQGSYVMKFLLADYMKRNPEVYQRMIAAYVIGYSITDEYLAQNPHLKFATGPDDTGVIISYNTIAPDFAGNDPVLLPGAKSINPITWTTEETLAPASASLGSLQLNKDGTVVLDADGSYKVVKNFADAQIDNTKNALICSTVDEDIFGPGEGIFGRGVYHPFDYPFYFFNLRANAANRANIFLNKE